MIGRVELNQSPCMFHVDSVATKDPVHNLKYYGSPNTKSVKYAVLEQHHY